MKIIIKINDNTLVVLGLILIYCATCIPIVMLTPTIFRMGLLALSVVFLLAVLVKNGKVNLLLNIIILVAFFGFYFFYVYSHISKPRYYLSNMFLSVLILAYSYYLLTNLELYDTTSLLKFILILSSITALTTIYGCFKYPYAVRELGRALKDTMDGDKNQFLALNIANWSQIYMLAFLIPCIVFLYKKSRKIYLLLIIILLEAAVIISQITFAILLSLLMAFLVYVDVPKTSKQFVNVITVAAILFLLLFDTKGILKQIINIVSNLNMEFLTGKLSDLYNLLFLKNATGDASGRFDLYGMSLNTFIKNPIIGVMFSNTRESMFGFHSEFLDLLAFGGIISVILELFYIFSYFKALQRYQGEDKKNLMVIFGGFLILFILNPVISNVALILGAFLMSAVVANYTIRDRSIDNDVCI